MNPPDEADWRSEPWSLDTEWAYQHFRGKTLEEAARLFQENPWARQMDLAYMPSRVFGYYARASMAYLTSDAAKGDAVGASGFLAVVDFKAQEAPEDLIPLWAEIEPVLRTLVEDQARYDADWVVYGSFRSLARAIAAQGFDVSFDVEAPEVVPETATIRNMARCGVRPLPFPVALQVFRNSGVEGFDASSKRPDVRRILGPPGASGGGHSRFGRIPDWERYETADGLVRFSFDGDSIQEVTFFLPDPDR